MTYTEEELEALAAAAGVVWITTTLPKSIDTPPDNIYQVWLKHHTHYSIGETREEAMNHYWNRYINGEVVRLTDDT